MEICIVVEHVCSVYLLTKMMLMSISLFWGDARNKCFALSLLNFSKLGGNLASGRICKLIMLKSAFLYATPTTWNRLQLITEAPNPVACKNPFLKCLFKCFIDQCVIGTCYKCVDDGALVNIAVVHSSLSKN